MKASKFVRFATFVCALVVAAGTSRAAFTDDLGGLRDELESRSLTLSNSVDKTEIKQKKACDKSIGLIDKTSKSLATDIKTANKVASQMIKAFPCEFVQCATNVQPAVVFSNSIVTVLLGAYTALGTDVQAEIITLGGLIALLPDGPDKLKAAAQFDIATNLLALAQTSPTFAQGGTLLGKSLKAALKGQKIASGPGATVAAERTTHSTLRSLSAAQTTTGQPPLAVSWSGCKVPPHSTSPARMEATQLTPPSVRTSTA